MNQIVRRIFAGVSAAILSVSAIGSDTWIGNFRQTLHADSDEPVLKQGSTTGFDSLEQDTRTDDSDNKIYNTNYGLHTDKTVSKAYSDGRTFDIDLESWYIGERPADVGMVLDASGSMAWTVDPLEPLNVEDKWAKLLEKEKTSYVDPETGFLTTAGEEYLLEEDWTDNSRLSYTDYRYYIYDSKSANDEFVPLGYWDGKLEEEISDPIEELKNTWGDSLIGFYPFTSREDLKIISSSNVINNGSIEIYDKDANKVEKDFSNFLVADKGLDNGEVDCPALALNKLNDNNN